MTKAIDADPLTIACWRGLFGGILVTAYVVRRRSSTGASLRLGWRGWLLALVGAAASIAFISAFKTGFVANVAIIYATVPFAAALLSLLLLGERFRLRTLLAAIVSMAGVAVMVSSGISSGSPTGDALALVMTLLAALYMVLIRKFRDTPVVWSGAVSAFLLFGFGWLVTDPLAVTSRDMMLLAAFGSSFALAVIMWTEGARLIPASEAGLLGSAEVPFAILFAWLLVAERPPSASLLGGAIVLSAVFAHGFLDLRRARSASLDVRSRRAEALPPVR
jgi:drug/metabolite transporter (DMT)-like permease